MSWQWPFDFVSRERYEEKVAELRDLKEVHERFVDEMNFRSTGFHLHARFATVQEPEAVEQAKPKSALVDAKVESEDLGNNPRSVLKTIEAKNMSEFEEKQKALRLAAAMKFDNTLAEADNQAAAQGAD